MKALVSKESRTVVISWPHSPRGHLCRRVVVEGGRLVLTGPGGGVLGTIVLRTLAVNLLPSTHHADRLQGRHGQWRLALKMLIWGK